MIPKTVSLAAILSLTLIATFPTTISSVHAASQNGPTTWSPFGPREKNLTITVYGDFQAMFNAFTAGQVDITDWPIQTANLGTGSSSKYCDGNFNPDFFCTTPTGELGIFDLQINHFIDFLGVPLQNSRNPPLPTFVLPASVGSSTCGTGHGQLTVTLQNQESSNRTILDSLNRLTISNQPSGAPSATVADSGGSNPSGTYIFPCMLAGTYKISSSVYNASSTCAVTVPTDCITIGSAQSISVVFRADWNSPSTRQSSTSGVYITRALAHLIDKPNFVNAKFGPTATYDDEMLAPAQGVPNQFSITGECPDHPWFSPCNPVSAYNLVSDNIPGGTEWWNTASSIVPYPPSGYSGVADLRAACDDFVKAGFTVVGGTNSTDCGNVALASIGTATPAGYPHLNNNGLQVTFFFRTGLGFRGPITRIVGDSLNFLFGTPNFGQSYPNQSPQCTVLFKGTGSCTINVCTFCYILPFDDGPVSAGGAGPNFWQLYVGGFTLTSTPDHLYVLGNSIFSGGYCAGTPQLAPNDYVIFCDPEFDTLTSAGEFTSSLTQSDQFFARAAAVGANDGFDVPIYSGIDTFVELNGWNFQQCNGSTCASTQSSIVNTNGAGTLSPFWTLLNARQVPGYSPSNPIYTPGAGDRNSIRMGFSLGTSYLSPFQFTTQWETNIVFEIFDSMLAVNPLTGAGNAQVVDWQTTSHSSSFNPSEVSCNALSGCITGTTTQLWHLRNDLKFQDGSSVTANDVAYSILAYRDVPSSNLGYLVSSVSSAVGLDCGPGQPCKTLQVKLQQESPFFEMDIGGLPIIEKSLWAPYCGDPPNPMSPCASLSFDPMSQGIMVGDGPFECIVPTGYTNAGHIGGPCTTNSDGTIGSQAVDVNGKILLTRYNGYARCCPDDTSSSLYKLSYADKNNDGVVNIQDLASAASCFGLSAGSSNMVCSSADSSYWANPNIAQGSMVNIQDLATVAFYYGHGTTYPFLPSQLTGLDPQIDPFFCPNTGC